MFMLLICYYVVGTYTIEMSYKNKDQMFYAPTILISFCFSLILPPTSSQTNCNIWVQIGNSSSRFIYHPREWGFIYQSKRYLDLLNADITMRRIVILCGAVSMPAILHQRYCWIVNRRVVAWPSHARCSCYRQISFSIFSYYCNLFWQLLLTHKVVSRKKL